MTFFKKLFARRRLDRDLEDSCGFIWKYAGTRADSVT
jgi:hypothetical protein